MIEAIVIVLVVLVVAGLVVAGRSLKVVQQFEQGIVFRFGKIQSPPRGAGLTVIRPVGDRLQKVNMQIIAMAVPAQEGITRDNVTVRVDAVVYFRVVDPIKAIVNVQNYLFAVSQQAQTSLRLRWRRGVVESAGGVTARRVMPARVELLRFFEKVPPAGPGAGLSPSLADFGDAEVAEAEAAIEGRPSEAGPPEAIPPVDAEAIPPVDAEAIPPVEAEAIPPVEAIDIPPVQAPDM